MRSRCPRNFIQYDLLISCPGDIVNELLLIQKVIEDFNATYLKIGDLSNWIHVENCFDKIMCIKLALANIGTMIDEDIDVSLKNSQDIFMTLNELPSLNEDTIDFYPRIAICKIY